MILWEVITTCEEFLYIEYIANQAHTHGKIFKGDNSFYMILLEVLTKVEVAELCTMLWLYCSLQLAVSGAQVLGWRCTIEADRTFKPFKNFPSSVMQWGYFSLKFE